MNIVHIGQPPAAIDPELAEWLSRMVIQMNAALQAAQAETKALKEEVRRAR